MFSVLVTFAISSFPTVVFECGLGGKSGQSDLGSTYSLGRRFSWVERAAYSPARGLGILGEVLRLAAFPGGGTVHMV